jgi:hypothetical protein
MKSRNAMLYLIFFTTLISGCALFGGGNDDQAMLDQLQAAGSDLSKPHPFDFYLFHPQQTGAQQLCSALLSEGFDVSIGESATGGDWLCRASLTMLPTLENLSEIDARFSRLIDQYGGEYDGWETIVLP